MDEVEGILFCLLNMLYYDSKQQTVEQEQISIVLGRNFVISFQEDADRVACVQVYSADGRYVRNLRNAPTFP
jgi:Mg2+ and Co2+ transporter CorA